MATVVFLHAHPDDEALLSAGTMRLLAERGHTVVLVVATDGAAGLAADKFHDLAAARSNELAVSARALGINKIEWLGYADSGLNAEATSAIPIFCKANIEEAAKRLTEILLKHNADVLVGYDKHGGYGHPDHKQVHKVALKAAEISNIPVLMEVTWDRQSIAGIVDRIRPIANRFSLNSILALTDGFTARADITHSIDVRRALANKRAAMKAHASQHTGGNTPRSLQVFSLLPPIVFKQLFAKEWFRQVWQKPHPTKTRFVNPFDELPQAKTK